MKKYVDNEIEHIDDQIEYGLLRAHNTMGGMTPSIHNTFIVKDNKFVQESCTYTPALVKAICEIVDNAIDEAIRTHFDHANKISIDIKEDRIIVKDNGRGIPTKNDNKGNPMFVTALTNVQAGSNFRDDENNNKKGTNGIGSSMSFILSAEANCKTITHTGTIGILKTNNNTRNVEFKIKDTNSKNYGTEIDILPDYERFHVETFDEVHQQVLYTYILNQAVCYPEIKFTFNGKRIRANSFKEYINFYDDEAIVFYSDDILDIAIYPTNEFKFTYFVNGLNVYDGGDALDYIINSINNGLKNASPKKYSKLTSSNFKNRLGYIVIYKNRSNLDWNGQTKQKCNSTFSKLQSPKIDWNILTNKLYKNKNIIEPILEMFKIQEEFESRKALKDLDKPKKEIRSEKYFPAQDRKKYLVISEGTSARASQLKALGNNEFGAYELTGVPDNVMELAHAQFIKTKKGLPELYNIIKNENYETILIGADKDLDGIHIAYLLLAFIYKYFPQHLLSGNVALLDTPLIVIRDKKGKLVKTIYTIDELKNYEKEADLSKLEVDYKKGYGSFIDGEFSEFMEMDGHEKMIDKIYWEDGDEIHLNNWLLKETVDYRKEKLLNNDFSINSIV